MQQTQVYLPRFDQGECSFARSMNYVEWTGNWSGLWTGLLDWTTGLLDWTTGLWYYIAHARDVVSPRAVDC